MSIAILHRKFESIFSRLTRWTYDHKYFTLIAVCVVTAIFAVQTPDLSIDTRDETFFHPDDPTLIAYNHFRDTFGQDDNFILALKPRSGLDADFFKLLFQLHQDLESSVPYLDDVTSLVNARVVRAEGDTLIVDDLMNTPPTTDADIQKLFNLIERYPLYDRLLISRDRTIAFLLIRAQTTLDTTDNDPMAGFDQSAPTAPPNTPTYLSNDQNMEINDAIHQVVDKYRNPDITFYFSGTPAFVAELQKGILKDLKIMIPLSFLVVSAFLLLLFRNLSGVAYPIITVALSLLSSLGIMAMTGIPISNAIQILPTFLVVVGIGDSVHILTIFYRNYRASGNKREAIIDAVGFAGLPVLMTSITTAAGLLSFAWADVAIVAQLGYVAPVGVMLAFFYTVFLIPVLIAIFPIKQPKATSNKHPASDRFFDAIAHITTGRPRLVIMISVGIMICAGYCALSLRFSHNSLTWLPADTDIRISTDYLDRINGGTVMLDITIDSGVPKGMHNPDLLRRIDEATRKITSIRIHNIGAGKAVSMVDILKETHRALNEDKDEAYAVPDTSELIAQELLLFESSGSDDLEEVMDSTHQISRMSILAPFADAILYKDYVDGVTKFLKQQLPEQKISLTGHMVIFVQMIKHFITSMAKSYVIALVIITLLMILLIGRIDIGLMSMIANIAPVLCVFGIMGIGNIPLDMATILIGSIVLGLVVDDTIHFLHHFRKAYDVQLNTAAAVRETLQTTGRALTITSIVLSGGFFIYTASFLNSNIRFGWLSGCAVLLALSADFLLIPALLTIVMGKKTENIKTALSKPESDVI